MTNLTYFNLILKVKLAFLLNIFSLSLLKLLKEDYKTLLENIIDNKITINKIKNTENLYEYYRK